MPEAADAMARLNVEYSALLILQLGARSDTEPSTNMSFFSLKKSLRIVDHF